MEFTVAFDPSSCLNMSVCVTLSALKPAQLFMPLQCPAFQVKDFVLVRAVKPRCDSGIQC